MKENVRAKLRVMVRRILRKYGWKPNGKRYSLETLLMIILMAELCGANTPMEIAEWAQHRKG